MDGILEALAFSLLIGGQFLAVIVVSRSKVTHAGPEERMQGTVLPDGSEVRQDREAREAHGAALRAWLTWAGLEQREPTRWRSG